MLSFELDAQDWLTAAQKAMADLGALRERGMMRADKRNGWQPA
jgi:hypothetical protein